MVESKESFQSILSSRAEKEISVSWDWYEDRQKGLGDKFVNEIIEKIRLIERNPEQYPQRFKSYRETKIKTFPFLIIYRISKRQKVVRIVSVYHTSRNPNRKY